MLTGGVQVVDIHELILKNVPINHLLNVSKLLINTRYVVKVANCCFEALIMELFRVTWSLTAFICSVQFLGTQSDHISCPAVCLVRPSASGSQKVPVSSNLTRPDNKVSGTHAGQRQGPMSRSNIVAKVYLQVIISANRWITAC